MRSSVADTLVESSRQQPGRATRWALPAKSCRDAIAVLGANHSTFPAEPSGGCWKTLDDLDRTQQRASTPLAYTYCFLSPRGAPTEARPEAAWRRAAVDGARGVARSAAPTLSRLECRRFQPTHSVQTPAPLLYCGSARRPCKQEDAPVKAIAPWQVLSSRAGGLVAATRGGRICLLGATFPAVSREQPGPLGPAPAAASLGAAHR